MKDRPTPRIIKLSYPERKGKEGRSNDIYHRHTETRLEVPEHENIYHSVARFLENHFPHLQPQKTDASLAGEKYPLDKVINLHNYRGITSQGRIETMAEKIRSGKEILTPEGLPNPKLAKTEADELVLFDGHHSTLAYMLSGKKYLAEIPHLLVSAEEARGVEDEAIHAFYGKHSSELKGKDWRNFAINWNVPEPEQLEPREQWNLGELFAVFTSERKSQTR